MIENYNIDYQTGALRGNKTKTQNFSTKRSLSFENLKSNECLAVLGANILNMLCVDYIIENYNLENIVIRQKESFLVKEENLFNVLPDSITNYLLISRQCKKDANDISLNRFKVDIFKSMLATM